MKLYVCFFITFFTVYCYGMQVENKLATAIRQSNVATVEKIIRSQSFDEQNKNYFRTLAQTTAENNNPATRTCSEIRFVRLTVGTAKLMFAASALVVLYTADLLPSASYYTVPPCATFCGVDGAKDLWKAITKTDTKNLYAKTLAVKQLVEEIRTGSETAV